jgi:hypothetical protein
MQPVTFISDVVATLGALGFSVLQAQLDGSVKRMTLLSLRDHNGWPKAVVIAPAETLVEVIF